MGRISSHLLRRDGRYYCRHRIPLDLVSLIDRKEFKKALGTACPQQAKRIGMKIRGYIESYFDNVRTLMSKDQKTKFADRESKAIKDLQEIADLQA